MEVRIEESAVDALLAACGTLTNQNIFNLFASTNFIVKLMPSLSLSTELTGLILGCFDCNLESARVCRKHLRKLLASGWDAATDEADVINERISMFDLLERQLLSIRAYIRDPSREECIGEFLECRNALSAKIEEM
ncbi:MAG: hypothetical protein HOJ57_01805 [Lentisphaerae bacterium]|jgi:hypothetical protein|nr:hypothetical protein [Lentisphaerota bacterium]MBT5604643.1 hypothetical protein [Lentisphaerota bacterium]